MRKIIFLLLLMPVISQAQLTKKDSTWLPLRFFIGEWTGKGGGEPGNGTYIRSYKWIMDKRFIEINNQSTYPPSPANKNKGEVHTDKGFFSYDGTRKCFMLRQFHTEGFVNQYKLDSISPDQKFIVFVTESIENIPAGFRGRESYKIISTDEFIETFEIAEPGKDFELYSKVTLKRKGS